MQQSKPSMFRAILGAIKKVISFSSRRDVKEMQKKYGATKEKKIKVIITSDDSDSARAFIFIVKDGKLGWIMRGAEEVEGDVTAYMDGVTLLNLLSGRIKVWSHEKQKQVYQSYRYFDAIRWGDITVEGDMASNDSQLAMRVFDDNIQDFQNELFPEVQAMIEEEGGE